MAPKRAEQRANRAKAKARATLSTAWDAGERPQWSSSSSQVSRIGNLRLTDAQGRVTMHGQQLRDIARERNEEVSFDPWVRGTELKGKTSVRKTSLWEGASRCKGITKWGNRPQRECG